MYKKERIFTLKREDPVPTEDAPVYPKVLKRKIITYPKTSVRDQQVPEEIIEEVKEKNKEYQSQLEYKEVADEIAEFESRMSGKNKQPPPIPISPPTPKEFEILQRISLPSPTKYFDVYTSPPSTCPPSPKTRYIKSTLASLPFSQKASPRPSMEKRSKSPQKVRPAVWSLLDEPTILSTANREPKGVPKRSKPFYPLYGYDDSKGIPILSKDMARQYEKKVDSYYESVRYTYTCDNQKKESELKKRVNENIETMRKKRQAKMKFINDIGQDWAQQEIARIHRSKSKRLPPVPPSKEELEALDYLTKRDNEMMDDRRLKIQEKNHEDLEMAISK